MVWVTIVHANLQTKNNSTSFNYRKKNQLSVIGVKSWRKQQWEGQREREPREKWITMNKQKIHKKSWCKNQEMHLRKRRIVSVALDSSVAFWIGKRGKLRCSLQSRNVVRPYSMRLVPAMLWNSFCDELGPRFDTDDDDAYDVHSELVVVVVDDFSKYVFVAMACGSSVASTCSSVGWEKKEKPLKKIKFPWNRFDILSQSNWLFTIENRISIFPCNFIFPLISTFYIFFLDCFSF